MFARIGLTRTTSLNV